MPTHYAAGERSRFSPSWHRVQNLKPSLRAHTSISRHRYRGETWHVVHDRSSNAYHRFRPAAYTIIGHLDGTKTLDQIWRLATKTLGTESPTQEETISLLAQLHASDLLRSGVPPDTVDMLERRRRFDQSRFRGKLLNPFSIRVHLLDPERFLARSAPYLARLLSRWAGIAWLLVVGVAGIQVVLHWPELTSDIISRVSTPSNIALLFIIVPLLKLLHEMGHAYAAHLLGAEVHDMGIMFLVFYPVPYVDASGSWSFPEKHKRAFVAAAGMIVELLIASVAFFLWMSSEPGTVKTISFNVVIAAGLTTLLFNANPLLRFDGYYILSDLIEIPNLRARANGFVGYLAQRLLFGPSNAVRPRTAPGEPPWLFFYSTLAFAYRLLITWVIVSWLMSSFRLVALVLGFLALLTWLVIPAVKGLNSSMGSPAYRRSRVRANTILVALASLGAAILLLVPVPHSIASVGIVWMPPEAHVRAETSGLVEEVFFEGEEAVEKGRVLLQLSNPELTAQLAKTDLYIEELELRYDLQYAAREPTFQVTEEQLRLAKMERRRLREKSSHLELRAAMNGSFSPTSSNPLIGRYLQKGDEIGVLLNDSKTTIRTLIPQESIELVRNGTREVRVSPAYVAADRFPGEITQISSKATLAAPSAALSVQAGGPLPTDPADPDNQRLLRSMYELEITVEPTERLPIGSRVTLLYDLHPEPIAGRLYRSIRQAFLTLVEP